MKCPICKSKKGKRTCLMTTTCICSTCCGTERKKDICQPCSYYREPQRNYKSIPYYRPEEMDKNQKRQNIANVIESAISAFDHQTDDKIKDHIPIKIFEYLLDVYFFKESHQPANDPMLEAGFQFVFNAIRNELGDVSDDELIKILGAIYFVARRRTTGEREYLNIIRKYVGISLGDGTRIMII